MRHKRQRCYRKTTSDWGQSWQLKNSDENGWKFVYLLVLAMSVQITRPLVFFKIFTFLSQNHFVQAFKGAVSRYSVIFCASKKWLLLAQMSWTSARSASFTIPAEWRKCRFPRSFVVFSGLALWPPLFSNTKWLPKITNYRDTAALNQKKKKQ